MNRQRLAILLTLAVLFSVGSISSPAHGSRVLSFQYQDLGNVEGPSWAFGMNEMGQIAGGYNDPLQTDNASLWNQQIMLDIGTAGVESCAFGINDAGQAVGYSNDQYGDEHAFLWSPANGMEFLDTLGGEYSWAYSINKHGQIVGESFDRDGNDHAVLWTPGAGITDLGNLGGTHLNWASAINNRGQVVGCSADLNGHYRAFLWTQKRGMRDLGTLGGQSCGFSVKGGWVVGYSYTLLDEDSHAFLWTKKGGMQDLNDLVINLPPGVTLNFAWDVNSYGEIIGNCTVDGVDRAFLLTPVN